MDYCLICKKEVKSLKHHLKSHKITTKEYYTTYISSDNKCVVCGCSCKFDSLKRGFYKTCSKKCKYKLIQLKNKEKAQQTVKKTKKTMKEKYGVEVFTQSLLYKQVMKEKYGVENSFQMDKTKQKIKQTMQNKYGVEHHMQCDSIKNKVILTHLKNNYNKIKQYCDKNELEFLTNFDDYKGERVKKEHYMPYRYEFKCKKCNTVFYTTIHNRSPKCKKCNNVYNIENEIYEFVKSFCTDAINNYKLYVNNTWREIDIYIPSKGIGIEFDGIYWHSSLYKDKNYHIEKTQLANQNNIFLIHIFENEWLYKQNIVKSIILNKLGLVKDKIYARKCIIKEISPKTKNEFLNNNHIQGEDKSRVKLGLFYDDVLVSVMTFGMARFNKNYEWELIRFCNKLNTSVVGGFSKLLKHFIVNYTPKLIITYADKRYSNGNVYEKNGFEYLYDSVPNYFYFKIGNNELFSRNMYQKHKLKDKLKKFDPSLSEYDNMKLNGYERIYDCGNKVYLKVLTR